MTGTEKIREYWGKRVNEKYIEEFESKNKSS
jgi:hypothetical protein